MKKLLVAFIQLLFAVSLHAQVFEITGAVTDTSSQSLPGAGVSLLNFPDSSIVAQTITDIDGKFVLPNVRPGNYFVKIFFIGYNDFLTRKQISTQPLNMGSIIMHQKSASLKEVNITEQIPPVQIKGDTTQYNADAFKTNKDATAEDLTLKMPGMTTQDGKVQTQGEEVKKVLIDGKPFLGDDPNAALKNLPAEVVDKIQVFDKKSDQAEFTGFDDGNTTKTINIVTRPQFRNGTFGRAFAGYGTDDKWKSGVSINFFKDKRKLTVLGNANDINEQNFAIDDLLGVIGTTGGNRNFQRGQGGQGQGPRPGGGGNQQGRYQPQNDIGNFLVDQKNGITKTYATGFNYANQWKKADFTFSYFFNRSENNSKTDITRKYFTSDNSDLEYFENDLNYSKNMNHRANMRLDYKFDSLNSILFQPRISIQDITGHSSVNGYNNLNGTRTSQAKSLYTSDLNALSFSTPLLYRHAFNKKGRTISTNLYAGYNENEGTNNLNSQSIFYTDSLPLDTMDQRSLPNSHVNNYSTEITYTEPVTLKSQLSFTYKGSVMQSVSDKSTYEFTPTDGAYNLLDTTLSNKFKSSYTTQSFGSGYRIANDKWNVMAGAAYQNSRLKNEQQFPVESTLIKNFGSVLPNAMIQYKFSVRNNIRMYYRSSNNSPSVTQLQNVINNSNPLQLSSGNPDLKQDWQNYVNVRYTAANPTKNTSFFVFISGSVTKNYLGNSTFVAAGDTTLSSGLFLPSGGQLIRPVNINGYYNLRTFGNYSFPLKFIKSSLNLNGSLNYSQTPGLINDVKIISKTSGQGIGFALSSNISDKVDFLLSSNANFSNITNANSAANHSFNLTSRVKFQVMPWKGLVLQTDLTHQHNTGLSASYNQNYILWNAGIGYKFLKDRLAELRLTAFDLLEENTSVSRNTTDVYYEDTRSDVLTRYFMVTFTYNLKFYKTGKS